MNVLIICQYGKNRSRYLAEYLQAEGYDTDYAGIGTDTDHRVTQAQIDWANAIIIVQPSFEALLRKDFVVNGTRLIVLDIDDQIPQALGSLEGDAWLAYQRDHVYSRLRDAIHAHLPL